MKEELDKSTLAGHTPKAIRNAEYMNKVLPREYLNVRLRYDWHTGNLRWRTAKEVMELFGEELEPRKARYGGMDFAPTANTQGNYVGTIDGYLVQKNHVIWCLTQGGWPDFHLEYADRNYSNHLMDNIRPKKLKGRSRRLIKSNPLPPKWKLTVYEAHKIFRFNDSGSDILWNTSEIRDPRTGNVLQVSEGQPAFPRVEWDKAFTPSPRLPRVQIFGEWVNKISVAKILRRGDTRGEVFFRDHDVNNVSEWNMVFPNDIPDDAEDPDNY